MPDLAALLRDSSGAGDLTAIAEWAGLEAMISGGGVPHALAACIPPDLVGAFVARYAAMILCLSGTGRDDCDSCRAWREGEHPDLIGVGSPGEPGGVADCLALQSALHLRPVVAAVRLGVVCSAEDMSLPAANSLLKLTEEPPESARILIIALRDSLIPTIRSRVWMVNFTRSQGDQSEPESPPRDPSGWAAWIERTRRLPLDDVAASAGQWAAHLCARQEWGAAASIQNIIHIARLRHMPVSMVQDALYALLWEGIRFEQIFGDLRET
ncbi:MAG: hypothetical protein LBQ56_01140 [Synergistaceae bacterium]|jgi:DNA polymerase-3 subunit delta'|nr:hypothetical protein [Synergistaceae bacterium]